MRSLSLLLSINLSLAITLPAYANTSDAPDFPITHCYHWLKSNLGYLDFKFSYAKSHNGELTFFTTPGTSSGAIAGPGLYCAKSPSQSYSYGDRVIKVEFVRDVVLHVQDEGKNYCGLEGVSNAECQAKKWDVNLYNTSSDWYVIQNPAAIARWTAVSADLMQDLETEQAYSDASYDAHSAATIEKMRNDPNKTQGNYITNSNARLSLAEILKKNRDAINSIPTLFVLEDLMGAKTPKELGPELYKWAVKNTARRFMLDRAHVYSKVKAQIESNAEFKLAFTEEADLLLAELRSKKVSDLNVQVLLAIINLNSNVNLRGNTSFFDLLLADPEELSLNKIGLVSLNSELQNQLSEVLSERISSEEKNIPNLLTYVSLGQRLNLNEVIMTPLKSELDSLLKKSALANYGLKTPSGFFPIVGTVSDSVRLCANYLSSQQIKGHEKMILQIGTTSMDLGSLGRFTPEGFCESKKDFFKGLVQSISTGKPIYFLHGNLQGFTFNFQLSYIDDLLPQVDRLMSRSGIQAVKNITVQFNNEQAVSLAPRDAPWVMPAQVAHSMEGLLLNNGMKTQKQAALHAVIDSTIQSKKHTVNVKLNTQMMTIPVDTEAELASKCVEYASAFNVSAIDTVQLSIDKGAGIKSDNKASYWQGPESVCKVVLQLAKKAFKDLK
jgi:hypothetical protein